MLVRPQVLGSVVYLVAIALFHRFLRAKPPLAAFDDGSSCADHCAAAGSDTGGDCDCDCGGGSCSAPSLGRVLLEVASGLVGYDLLFTPLHWALHAPELRRAFARADGERVRADGETARADGERRALPAAASAAAAWARGSRASFWGGCVTSRRLALATNPLAWVLTRRGLSRTVAAAFAGPPPAAWLSTPAAVAGTETVLGGSGGGGGCVAMPSSKPSSSSPLSWWGWRWGRGRAQLGAVTGPAWCLASGARRWVGHGTHHDMRGALQAGATVHHSLPDGALQVHTHGCHTSTEALHDNCFLDS